MRATIAFALVAAAAAAPAVAEEQTSGVIAGEWGYVEILPEAPPPGTTIQLREGWIRVESAPDDEEPGSGSFGVISADALALAQQPEAQPPGIRTEPQPGLRAAPGRPEEPQQPGYPPSRPMPGPRADRSPYPQLQPHERDEGAVPPGLGPCYEEREEYARQVLRMAGIEDVEHPLALFEALGITPGLSPWVRFNLFGLPFGGPWAGSVAGVDPVRPLAWDDDLQYAARELTACMRTYLGFDDRLVDPDVERQQAAPAATEPAQPPSGGSL